MNRVHRHMSVSMILDFLGDVAFWQRFDIIRDHLRAIAERVYGGMSGTEKTPYIWIQQYHPQLAGWPIDMLAGSRFTIDDCLLVVAKEHGFADWETVEAECNQPYDMIFQQTVDLLLNGNLSGLESSLRAHPELIEMRSRYGHRATLLHYCAVNGVELRRQQVPLNLQEMVKFLLSAGADISATMPVYGALWTPLALFETSSHPYDAGIGSEVEPLLRATTTES